MSEKQNSLKWGIPFIIFMVTVSIFLQFYDVTLVGKGGTILSYDVVIIKK